MNSYYILILLNIILVLSGMQHKSSLQQLAMLTCAKTLSQQSSEQLKLLDTTEHEVVQPFQKTIVQQELLPDQVDYHNITAKIYHQACALETINDNELAFCTKRGIHRVKFPLSKKPSMRTLLRSQDENQYHLLYLLNNVLLSSLTAQDFAIKLWDLETGFCIKKLVGHSNFINALQNLPNNRLASAAGNIIKIWDVTKNNTTQNLTEHSNTVNALTISDQYLISGSDDCTIKIWDVEKNSSINSLHHEQSVMNLKIIPDSLITGGMLNQVSFWDMRLNRSLKNLSLNNNRSHVSHIEALEMIPSDNHILMTACQEAGMNSTIKLWDLRMYKCLTSFGIPGVGCNVKIQTNYMYIESVDSLNDYNLYLINIRKLLLKDISKKLVNLQNFIKKINNNELTKESWYQHEVENIK